MYHITHQDSQPIQCSMPRGLAALAVDNDQSQTSKSLGFWPAIILQALKRTERDTGCSRFRQCVSASVRHAVFMGWRSKASTEGPMETVILEKTIIKSKTEKGNHRASNISHGVVGNTCWKWMICVNIARKNAFEAFPRPLNRWKTILKLLRLGSLLALGFGEAGPLRSLFAKAVNDWRKRPCSASNQRVSKAFATYIFVHLACAFSRLVPTSSLTT